MRIPRFWAEESHVSQDDRGNNHTFSAWGWSFENITEAKEAAMARARRIKDFVLNDKDLDTYDYLDRPMREEIVESFGDNGQETALITRNRYGALILNTASVCFVDVDFPTVKLPGLFEAIGMLFSKEKREARAKLKDQATPEATIKKVMQWADDNPGRSFRLYRTFAGLRLLFTDQLYDPIGQETATLMEELGSDMLYRKLTEKQECFRARLTPKPWRCNSQRPPNCRYPWSDPEKEKIYRDWQREYEAISENYSTCQLIETIGDNSADEQIASIIDIHDGYACRDSIDRLA